jgi:hypothetical protein
MQNTVPITPFCPEYVSQITPFKERPAKRPDLKVLQNYSINPKLPGDDKIKQQKIRKANI